MKKQYFKVKDIADRLRAEYIQELVDNDNKIDDGVYAKVKNGVLVIIGDGHKLTVKVIETIVNMFDYKSLDKLNIFYFGDKLAC